MGGENDVVVDHIWSNLTSDENGMENVIDHLDNGDVQRTQYVPQLHADWLSEPKKTQSGNKPSKVSSQEDCPWKEQREKKKELQRLD